MPGETGKGQGDNLVHMGVVGEYGRSPGADQDGDARVGIALAQEAQGRGGKEQVAQVVGADEEEIGDRGLGIRDYSPRSGAEWDWVL